MVNLFNFLVEFYVLGNKLSATIGHKLFVSTKFASDLARSELFDS